MVVLLEKSIQDFTQNIPEYNEKLEGIAVKIFLGSNDETAWLGMLLGPNFDETDLADTDCVNG